jgi:hypothetical protein
MKFKYRSTFMKQIALIFLTFITLTSAYAQTDDHGNPVFNSVIISEEHLEGFEVTSSYYTIDNNISNKGSSVYVSDKPTLADYLKFARELPSHFFIVHEGQNVLLSIILLPKVEGSGTTFIYHLINPSNGKSMQLPCKVSGEITEKRADELLKLNVDTSAKIIDLPMEGNGLLFDGTVYRIQPYNKVKEEVIALLNELAAPEEEIKDPVEYIKKETIGGELDFNKILEAQEQTLFLQDGIAYNKKDFAIFMWGAKVKMLGIKSSKKAVQLWEEINKRSLTAPEEKALISGYKCKFD